jgi:hypothetical protein
VPNDERFVVNYTPGKDLLVTWAINNGQTGDHPAGTPTCTTPPTSPPSTTSPPTTAAPTTAAPTTAAPTSVAPTTTAGSGRTTQEQARYEAKQILQSIRSQITTLKLDIPGVQLIGTYPIQGTSDEEVVQVLYTKATVQGTLPDYKKMFDVPPAEVVQCLNPAFDL